MRPSHRSCERVFDAEIGGTRQSAATEDGLMAARHIHLLEVKTTLGLSVGPAVEAPC